RGPDALARLQHREHHVRPRRPAIGPRCHFIITVATSALDQASPLQDDPDMRDVTDMPQQKSRWAKKGALAMAATALAVTGCAAGTASAAPPAAVVPAAFAAPAASAAPAAAAADTAKTVTTSVAAPAAYTPPTRNLAEGMSGADVKALQQRLSVLKYYPGTIDGK